MSETKKRKLLVLLVFVLFFFYFVSFLSLVICACLLHIGAEQIDGLSKLDCCEQISGDS